MSEINDLPSGLAYKQDVISESHESKLLEFINSQQWQDSLKRKVQHYGFPYNYQTRKLDTEFIPIPTILLELATELKIDEPKNIIINRYLPGEGIASHIDSYLFGDCISCLSLNSGIQIDFSNRNKDTSLYLLPRSLLTMSGDARREWKHGIVGRKSDHVNGKKILRRERISITFRTLS